ncbi:hypothetical protein OG225_16400 [Nocardia sp. NBC_01377]|uniref:hypothetical protein n=1 Tax=Nocardia sp. NBC_01377 TaxID=2903595 RepID=UPI00324C99EB
MPGPPDDVGYTSSGCAVSGRIEGSEIVGGYGGVDRMYCLPGISAQISKMAHLEHYWFVWGAIFDGGHWETGNAMLGAGGYATATFHRQGEAPLVATNDEVDAKVLRETKGGVSQPHLACISFCGRTFDFQGTHNAAACAAALGIAWLHGTVREQGGPEPTSSWSTMEVIERNWAVAREGAPHRAGEPMRPSHPSTADVIEAREPRNISCPFELPDAAPRLRRLYAVVSGCRAPVPAVGSRNQHRDHG